MRIVLMISLLFVGLWAEDKLRTPLSLPLGPSYEAVWREEANWKPGLELPEGTVVESSPLALETRMNLDSFGGDVQIASPLEAWKPMSEGVELQVWDRILLGEKSSIVLKFGAGVVYEAGSGSLLQIMELSDGQTLLRLLKGKLRVVNGSTDKVVVETLNAMVWVPHGKTDLIISAMNTLVAPREGGAVSVKTQKVYRSVESGRYGLVMADGSLLDAGGKGR